MARLNEIAYGYPPGDFVAVAEASMDGAAPLVRRPRRRGRRARSRSGPTGPTRSSSGSRRLPEARGRGVSGWLLAHALRAAADDGLETTTLQATKLGYPVYEKLGYRDLGSAQMWERRRTAD